MSVRLMKNLILLRAIQPHRICFILQLLDIQLQLHIFVLGILGHILGGQLEELHSLLARAN